MNNRQKLVQQQFLNNEKAVIGRLNSVYNQSLKDITDKIKKLEFDIGNLKTQYDWLDTDDPKKAKIKSMIQSKIYQKNYQESLQRQISGILDNMQTKQYLTVSDYLDGCYTDGFIGTIFDAHGQGVPIITPIDQESMVRAVQLDSKISKGLYTRLGEDVSLLKKKITAQVSRSIATGESYAQMAKQLTNYTRIGYNNAVRIARTEGHRIQNAGAMDAMSSAKEKGADVLKQWDATLDDSTRESHVAVDGEIRELDEPFSNGLDYPGDPSGGAAEVVNCRCALLQRARWALDDKFTKFNNFTKQAENFDGPDDYSEFKNAFFSTENKQLMKFYQSMEEEYRTRDFKTILYKMTDKQYDKFSFLTVNNPLFVRKGFDLSSNNGIRMGVIHDAVESRKVSLLINDDKQKRHIVGSDKYTKGRSYLNVSLEESKRLLNELKGTGDPIFDDNGDWLSKERVEYSDYVGVHVDNSTGKETRTKKLLIIYSKTGCHLVPRR